MDLESVLALDRPPPRWHMLPAFSGVLLLHAALLYGINLTDDMLQAASGEDQPVYVELVNAPPQPPVIPEPPPAPEPAPVYEVPKPKPKPKPKLKPKPKPKPKEPPPPKPAPEPPPAEPAPANLPPGPPTPPVQGEPNAPAGATPQQGSGTPGPVGPPPVLGSSQITYIRQPKPVYPAFSKRAGETGKVMLRVLVDVNGRPKEVKLEKSSGSDRLDKAAIDAARNALLSPHKENGKPREAYVLMPIVFELEN